MLDLPLLMNVNFQGDFGTQENLGTNVCVEQSHPQVE